MTTNVTEFISDLDAGIFEQKIGQALSDVALGVVNHHAPGKVTITMELNQIGASSTVNIKHNLVYTKPTSKGDVTEKNKTETPMHVGDRGKMTLFPENQGQMFDKRGDIASNS